MRLLVTGATGFLGSRIVALALEAGHDVTVLVRPSSSMERIEDVAHRIARVTLGARSDAVAGAARETGPVDAVVHAAATYGKGESLSRIVATNIALGLELLEVFG